MLIKDSGYLFAMLKMCDDIELYKQKFGSTLLEERIGLNASLLNISQIGEYAKNLSTDFQNRFSKIEWIKIKGLRNQIVHNYFGVDREIIEEIVYKDIPLLIDDLLEILNCLKDADEIDIQVITELSKDLLVIKIL